MKKIIALCIFAGLAGCASLPVPTAYELAHADYGDEPGKYDFGGIKGRIQGTYRFPDPDSTIWKIGTERGYVYSDTHQILYGYHVYITLNTKNLYGGYSGEQVVSRAFLKVKRGTHAYCWENHCGQY
jgi:hypothetical protein